MALTDWLLLLLLQLMMMMMMTLVRILLPQQSMQSSLFTLGIDQIMTATCRISNAELTQIHTLHGDASTVILVGVYNSLCRTHWTHRWIYSSLLILVSVLYSCREACTRDVAKRVTYFSRLIMCQLLEYLLYSMLVAHSDCYCEHVCVLGVITFFAVVFELFVWRSIILLFKVRLIIDSAKQKSFKLLTEQCNKSMCQWVPFV